MKKGLLLIIISLIAYSQLLSQNDYYYSANKKIIMANTENKYVIGISDSSDFITLSKVAKNITPLFSQSYIITLKDTIVAKQTLNHFDRRKIPVKTIGDVEIIFTGEVLLKPKTEYGIRPIIAFSNGILSIKEYTAYNTYVMNVSNWDSLFYISNKVYESGMVEYCHPNFIVPVNLNYDPLYESQYYLNSPNNIDINAPDAWLLANNATNIKIAVIDEGVEEHEDLVNKVLPGMTVSYSNDRPNTYGRPCSVAQPTSWLNSSVFAHGEACAGIIAADHNNNKGIKGVINNAQIVPINIFNNWYMEVYPSQYFYIKYRETVNDYANAINAAWNTFGCDVLNNSWTYRATDYSNIPYADNLIDAIHNATTYGRNGKGSIVVFSSGNDNQYYSGVSFPANVAGVIAVGAINANTGIIQNYSGRGPELSLVAPSGTNTNDLVTCDRMGSLGYNTENNGHYTDEFGGTSAACPQVSGVAALMLSVNPNLTSQEVTTILQTTARDLGTPGFDNTYGYGLVDAHKAVVYAMEYGYDLAILGDSTLSDCDNKTYTCDILHPELFTYVWSITPNLSIINDNDSSITVIPVSTGIGTITVDVYQQGRLMYTLTKIVNVISIWSVVTPVSTIPFHVSSNITWSSKVFLPVPVTIDSLATLTIADTLFCTPASRIIVKPGGKLVVDGGTLTSACEGEMWQGIYVEGHRDQPQTAANQGTVQLLNGAVVENAIKGIRTSAPGSGWNTTGGIITADNATFRNCAKAVEYLSYAGTNYAGLVIDNKGSFTNCTFTVDDNNLFATNGTDLLAHVSLWEVKGVEFTHCRFEDARTGNHSRKSAISALDAGFEMKTGCSYNVPRPECDCPPASSTHSSFEGFGTAIDAGTSGSPYEITIDGAQFSDNITGVRIEGSSHATVTRCTFDLSDMPVRVVSGLCLDGCTGYLVEGNTFTRGASAPNGSRYGIRMNNSGTDANRLYRNTFERLSHGIYVTGTNGDVNSNIGLQMTCNGFTSNTYDIYVASGATMGPSQGSSSKGADNTFSGTQTSSLYNAGSQRIDYYYSTGTNHSPQNPVGNVTLHANAGGNDCASTLCVLDPSNPGPGPKSPTPSFLALKQQYENLMADFNRNGYADILSTAIPPVAESPASPGELAAAQYASQQMNAIASELFAQSHEAVRALMSDTLEDLRAVVAWLGATPGLASRYLEAETEFVVEANDNSPIQDVATHLTTTTERDEYDNYMAFHTLKQALEEGGHVMWPNATDAQIGELIRIADANTGRSSLLAKNVLCFFFGICYDDMETRALETTTIPPTAEPPTLTESRMKAESPTLTGQQNITVHPNPADDVLHVTVTDGEIARVEMFDMFGRITMVGTQNLASPPSPEYTVDLSSLPAGLYILRVTLTDGTVQNIKVARK